jgi:hypothetical protein
MTGVSGIAFFKIEAASAPFNRGMARSRSIKSGCDPLAFRTASTVYSFAHYQFRVPAFEQHANRQTHGGAVIGNKHNLSHESS